jgi:hypothetical protein
VAISQYVQASPLPEHLSLQECLDTIEEISSPESQQKYKEARIARADHIHAKFLRQGQEPWAPICSAIPTLDALQIVGNAILCSDSGFVGLDTAVSLVVHVYADYDEECPWVSRKHKVIEKLLRYLPIMCVQLDASLSGQATTYNFSARPPDVNLHQVATMAAIANTATAQTQVALRSLPMDQYLQAMGSERDRRIFKGVIAAITNPTFVRSAFNWQAGSIASIGEDLGLIDCYLSDLHQMLQSVSYCSTPSPAIRKRMRRQALLRSSLNGFLTQKRGGRPSLIDRYS